MWHPQLLQHWAQQSDGLQHVLRVALCRTVCPADSADNKFWESFSLHIKFESKIFRVGWYILVMQTPTLQKSRMLQIRGVQGCSCSALPQALGNEGYAVCSAFPKGKKHGNFSKNHGCHHWLIPKCCLNHLWALIVVALNLPLSCFLCN